MATPPQLRLPSPLQPLDDEVLAAAGVRLWLKRDDLIHPELPGNKWRKLKYNLAAAAGRDLLTFGGAYSGHIRATAAAGHYFGLGTTGVIRGEPHEPLNWSLRYAASQGMRLRYLDRQAYRRKTSPEIIDALRRELGDFYLLPEGGSNALAVRGCAELTAEVAAELGSGFDVICCPCGTGGTLAGIAAGLAPHQQAIGFSVLKGGEFLAAEVARLQRAALGDVAGDWRVECAFHFGGYARRTPELDAFIATFERQHALRLEWVYVAKMMSGIFTLARQHAFRPGTRLVAVITAPPTPPTRDPQNPSRS
jgi:1-aminocyclopropane-1-carboxylate deaminase/D-cysteine desulfhydrase-like pyridoxal-dependent ACC family enzyme